MAHKTHKKTSFGGKREFSPKVVLEAPKPKIVGENPSQNEGKYNRICCK